MIDLAAFENLLTKTVLLRPAKGHIIDPIEQNARAWSAALSAQTEALQYQGIKSVLSELVIAEMADARRMQLMEAIYPSMARLIGQLHQHYIYETSVLEDTHIEVIRQVNSLYYLSILVYHGVIRRQDAAKASPKGDAFSKLKRLANSRNVNNEMSLAVYSSLSLYLRLLMEHAIDYYRPPAILWQQINQLYKIAFIGDYLQQPLTTVLTKDKNPTIENVYKQACLHHLLGLRNYRRQDILGTHRYLANWASSLILQQKVDAKLRLFIDLNSDTPPTYLTPHTTVNPYDVSGLYLFIDTQLLLAKLNRDIEQANEAQQVRLSHLARQTLSLQLTRQQNRHDSQMTASILTGFNAIHYQLAGKKPLSILIEQQTLPQVHFSKFDTASKETVAKQPLPVDIRDTSKKGYRFRWTVMAQQKKGATTSQLRVSSLFIIKVNPQVDSKATSANNKLTRTQLKRRSDSKLDENTWQLGLIRWIERTDDFFEAGGQIIGYNVTACGLRLDSKDERSQDFFPSLLVGGDNGLDTNTTLLLPHYHFREGDKVVLRIKQQQTLLRLDAKLIGSEGYEQYRIVRLES